MFGGKFGDFLDDSMGNTKSFLNFAPNNMPVINLKNEDKSSFLKDQSTENDISKNENKFF